MELLRNGKDRLKDKVRLLYQSYGHLCATSPLPMITSSVILVVLCSLPLLSHPVFERTATFLFGRIQIGKYQTNVSVLPKLDVDKGDILIQQFNIKLNITIPGNEQLEYLDSWMVFEKGLEKAGIKGLKRFCSKSTWWQSSCLHVSRKPFYKSPQTRLIYPRGRFYKELRKWFSKEGCLFMSPTAIFGIDSRKYFDLPGPFKEMLLGYPQKQSGLMTPLKFTGSHSFRFTITFFMKEYSHSLSNSVNDYLKNVGNATVMSPSSSIYRIKYMPLDNETDTELILLGFTYVLVFLYILFSVGKSDILKSRWGLAFSAVMTIIMSLMMALGVCALLDLLPTTLTITEIFPYIVIVIGLENVMIITKSVVSMEPDIDVSVRVAKGMGKEGWYITKNICAELAILGAGYYTHIPSVQEFCIFAFAGVLSDFFLQMVFFAPILAVDIRRAEICHLQQITTAQQFAVGFNLMQKTALKLVPPSPPKTKWSRFVDVWLKRRMFQKAFMTAVIAYIIYAAYHKVESSKHLPSKHQESPASIENPLHRYTTPPNADTAQAHTKPNVPTRHKPTTHASIRTGNVATPENIVFDYAEGAGAPGESELVSWNFLSKQHWPELLTFYHIRFHERSLVVLPTAEVFMSMQLNETQQTSNLTFTKTSSAEDILLVLSLAVIFIFTVYLVLCICDCTSKLHRKKSLSPDVLLFEADRQILRGHRSAVEFLAAEESFAVSSCLGGSVRVWDLKTSDCVMEIHPAKRFEQRTNCVSNTTLRHRRFSNMEKRDKFPLSTNVDSIWCIDFKNNLIAIGYSSGKVQVYNITGKKAIGQLTGGEAVVTLRLASRNTALAGRVDGILDIIEVKRGQLDSVEDIETGDSSPRGCSQDDQSSFGCQIKHRIRAHLSPIENVIVFAGLVLSSADDMIKLYEIDDGNCRKTLPSNNGQVTIVHQIKESTTLSAAVGYENGSILLISMTGDTSFECIVHGSPVLGIASNARYFASFDSDNNVLVWSMIDGQCKCTQAQVTTHALQLHFLDESSLCIISKAGKRSSKKIMITPIDYIQPPQDQTESMFAPICCAFLLGANSNLASRGMTICDASNGEVLHHVENAEERESQSVLARFPSKNSILLARHNAIEHIIFRNLVKQVSEDAVR